MTVFVLHGFELSGSGSNLFTRELVSALTQVGQDVVLFCHEPAPELFPFVTGWCRTAPSGAVIDRHELPAHRPSRGQGSCTVVLCELGSVVKPNHLTVYNLDVHEGFDGVVSYTELSSQQLEQYIDCHYQGLRTIVDERSSPEDLIIANHVTPLAEAARRMKESHGLPFVLVPHGSAIEYGARVDHRLMDLARSAVRDADVIIAGSPEMQGRLLEISDNATRKTLQSRLRIRPFGVRSELFVPPGAGSQELLLSGLAAAPEGGVDAECRSRLQNRLRDLSCEGLRAACEEFRQGHRRDVPDREAASRLRAVDWDNEDTILYSGKLVAGKGVQLLLALLPELLEGAPRARLIIAGEGSFRPLIEALLWSMEQGNAEVVDAVVEHGWSLEGKPGRPLEHLAAHISQRGGTERWLDSISRSGLSRRVIFSGWLTHAQLAPLLALSRVSVLPSIIAEASPLVIGESLAASTPIVVTTAGGSAALLEIFFEQLDLDHRDFVADPAAGLLTEQLTMKLRAGLSLGSKMRNALSKSSQRFTWEVLARGVLSDAREKLHHGGEVV